MGDEYVCLHADSDVCIEEHYVRNRSRDSSVVTVIVFRAYGSLNQRREGEEGGEGVAASVAAVDFSLGVLSLTQEGKRAGRKRVAAASFTDPDFDVRV